MKSRLLCGATVLLWCANAAAALVDGLSVRELAPPEFANSTVLSIAADPSGGIWYSNGFTLFSASGDGSSATSETLRGPLGANSATDDITFDSQGNLYIADLGTGTIYRRDAGQASWAPFATTGIPFIRSMGFAESGDLIVAASVNNIDSPSTLYRISPSGAVSVIASGLSPIDDFDFNARGNVVFADFVTGDIYEVDIESGAVTGIGNGKAVRGLSLVEAFAVTSEGYMLLGINTGADEAVGGGNTNRLDRFDPATGVSIVLGVNYTSVGCCGYRLPVDFFWDPTRDELLIAAFGSIVPLTIAGDLDADFGNGLRLQGSVPAPATLALLGIGLAGLAASRRPRKYISA